MSACLSFPLALFQFTHPGRGATSVNLSAGLAMLGFQFTHPGRGATLLLSVCSVWMMLFQFTHPGRGATTPLGINPFYIPVSIHAPREGCD